MVQVQQWSGCIKRKGSNFELNLKKITDLVTVAMGELSGLPGLLNDLEGTLLLTCDTSSTNNHFVKVDMSECSTKLLGVSFYSVSNHCSCIGFNSYSTELNCKMISADVSQANKEQVDKIKEYFNNKFNIIVKPTKGSKLCGPPPIGTPKKKEYKITSEDVPSSNACCVDLDQISPSILEDGSDEDICQAKAE